MITVGHDPARYGVSRYGDRVWMMQARVEVSLRERVVASRSVADVRGLDETQAWSRARDLAADVGLQLSMPDEEEV